MNTFKKTTLNNGLKIITIPVENSNSVTVLILVGTGSKYETRDINGISHFLEHMFFKGTTKRPTTLAIASELDALGGEYNAFTSKEYTGYFVKVAKEKNGTDKKAKSGGKSVYIISGNVPDSVRFKRFISRHEAEEFIKTLPDTDDTD